ncbi:MAG: hypothetical protein RL760_1430 [Candidatus Eisenbacteria bacterium]
MNDDSRIAGVSPEMFGRIREVLTGIEHEERVRICLAVETGSRASGLASPTSDHDVRFVYVRRTEAYLDAGIRSTRDVIERPIDAGLDVNGWDVRKALGQYSKSNTSLMEWLQMEGVYMERFTLAAGLRELMPTAYSPRASFHTYLNRARNDAKRNMSGAVSPKGFLLVLQGLLAMRWLHHGLGPVPCDFHRLFKAVLNEQVIARDVESVLDLRRSATDVDVAVRWPHLVSFVEDGIAAMAAAGDDLPVAQVEPDELDRLFRAALREAWGPEIPQ